MKKILACLLAMLMLLALCTGCGAAPATDAPATEEPVNDEVMENQFTFGTLPTVGINWDELYGEDGLTPPAEAAAIELESYTLLQNADKVYNDKEPVRYVMIYNPAVYDPNYPEYNYSLSTGNLGMQVEVDLNKGGLEEEKQHLGLSQDQLNADLPLDEISRDSDRAGAFVTPYKVGDTKVFYSYDSAAMEYRLQRNFTCRYAGQYCNIWVADCNLSDALIQDYGTQFDTHIYESVVETFGQPRFASNGSKVNLLYYPLPTFVGGCFSNADLYADYEFNAATIEYYGLNTNHDILHINSDMCQIPEMQTYMRSTMAHEFQHLICGTAATSTLNLTFVDTWLNEAMSGYIEEKLYPGVKEGASGHLPTFHDSDLVRNGQSLYNFATTDDDIGVYGSVYLFSEYLATLAGDDVFFNLHSYWRNSYSSTLCTAEALNNAVSEEVYNAVDRTTPYPISLQFYSEEERWMSKLTLRYYLELLDQDATDPAVFDKINNYDLLYNQINSATIEGGGRIIIALQDDVFYIPEDADPGLIYVGLNEDFEVITSLIMC